MTTPGGFFGLRQRVDRLGEAWRRLRPLLGNRTGRVLILSAAALGAGVAEAGVLALVAKIASVMVVGDHRLDVDMGPFALHVSVGAALLIALALAIVRMGLHLVVGWLPARISADVECRLRTELFAAYSEAAWSVQAQEPEGHLQELMTSQVNQAVIAVINVATLLSSAAMFAALTVTAFVLSVTVAVVVLISAVGLFALLRPLNRWGRTAARDLSQANMDHAAGVSEAVRLSEEAQVFGTAEAHRHSVGSLIDTAGDAHFRFQLAARLSQSSYQGMVILLIVAGLGGLYAAGPGDLAALGAVVLMLVRAASYGQIIQGAYLGLLQTLPYIDRLEAATARFRLSRPVDGGQALPMIHTVGFQDVNFSYRPGRSVLSNVTFDVQAGEAIGIVGPSGAGKSTLVQLLLRLREPGSGAFLVNGESAFVFARSDFQRRVAYVAQEPRIMAATVADNIRYLRPLDDDEVVRAAKLAHIHHEIVSWPAGYQTVVGQRADAVSGGQRQRLCLARALAGRPDVLVLDEPTSALDSASEVAVQASLGELHGELTLFIVAHRLSTLKICDRVLVLGDGSVQAFAPADQLEQTNAFYREAVALIARPA